MAREHDGGPQNRDQLTGEDRDVWWKVMMCLERAAVSCFREAADTPPIPKMPYVLGLSTNVYGKSPIRTLPNLWLIPDPVSAGS